MTIQQTLKSDTHQARLTFNDKWMLFDLQTKEWVVYTDKGKPKNSALPVELFRSTHLLVRST